MVLLGRTTPAVRVDGMAGTSHPDPDVPIPGTAPTCIFAGQRLVPAPSENNLPSSVGCAADGRAAELPCAGRRVTWSLVWEVTRRHNVPFKIVPHRT